jgi:hypothetical protein
MNDARGWSPGVITALRNQVFAHPGGLSSGVLVGVNDAGAPRIDAIIPALAGARPSTEPLDRTHWGYVHETLSRVYPAHEVVGWYVARPGLGARVAEADVAIHHQFFPDAQHFLLAVDPSDGTAAAYVGVPGGVSELYRGRIHHDELDSSPMPAAPSARPNLKIALLGAAVGTIIWLLAGAGPGPLG